MCCGLISPACCFPLAHLQIHGGHHASFDDNSTSSTTFVHRSLQVPHNRTFPSADPHKPAAAETAAAGHNTSRTKCQHTSQHHCTASCSSRCAGAACAAVKPQLGIPESWAGSSSGRGCCCCGVACPCLAQGALAAGKGLVWAQQVCV
jgi:hypothetical protein